MEAKISRHLTFTTNAGIDLNNFRSQYYQNRIVGDGVTPAGRSTTNSNEFRTITMNQLVNYKQKFGAHEVAVLVGHESQKNIDETFSASRTLQNLDGNIELANFVTLATANGQLDRLRREGYLSRLNYAYDNKYYFDFSYRKDASSRFSPDSRWGDFYSFGFSWSAMREKLFSSVNWLDDLKFRVSYGAVGNDELDSYYRLSGAVWFGLE